MRVSELLTAIASWLESPENEALLLAEYHEDSLKVVAETCVKAAEVLKQGAATVDAIEPMEESKLTPEALDHLNEVITALDQSDDAEMKKTANVLDELLLTLAVPPNWVAQYKQAQENRLDVLKNLYEDNKKQHDEMNGVKEAVKAIDKSPMFKEYRPNQHELKTRTCPDHYCPTFRVGENMYKCSLDGKVFNYSTGYTTETGDKVPGESVAAQTPGVEGFPSAHAIFDTRQSRLSQ